MIPKINYPSFVTSIACEAKTKGKTLAEKTSQIGKGIFVPFFTKEPEQICPKPNFNLEDPLEIEKENQKNLLNNTLQEYREKLKSIDHKDSLVVADFVKDFMKDDFLRNSTLELREIQEENKKIENRFLDAKIKSLKLFKPFLEHKFTPCTQVLKKVELLEEKIETNLFFPFLDSIEKPLSMIEYEIEKAKFIMDLDKELRLLENHFEKKHFSKEKLNTLEDLLQKVFLKYLTKLESIERAYLLFPKICQILEVPVSLSPFQVFDTPQKPPIDLELKHQILDALYG